MASPLSLSPPAPVKRAPPFSRLRTTHDCVLRRLVHASWDQPPATSPATPSAVQTSTSTAVTATAASVLHPALPPRAITDVSGRALRAAHLADVAAQRAAHASHHARAAADYARRLAQHDSTHEPPPPLPRDSTAPKTAATKTAATKTAAAKTIAAARCITDFGAALPNQSQCLADNIGAERSRPPAVRVVRIGERWEFDLLALWHNAIRYEMLDCLAIVDCLLLCDRYVTLCELHAFFAWFDAFEAFVICFLKAEEELIYPWLEQWGRIHGCLSTLKRITMKGAITRTIRDTAACAQMLGVCETSRPVSARRRYHDALNVGLAELPPSLLSPPSPLPSSPASSSPPVNTDATTPLYATVVATVAERVTKFCSLLYDYMALKESYLPCIISSLYEKRDADAALLHRRVLSCVWKSARKEHCVMMVLRAAQDAGAQWVKRWTVANLRRVERVALPVWRRRYAAARGAVVLKFRARHAFWLRAAAAARLTRADYHLPHHQLHHRDDERDSAQNDSTAAALRRLLGAEVSHVPSRRL